MNPDALIDRLIYPGDRSDPDSYRRGKFFLISVFIFFDLNLLAGIFYGVSHHSARDVLFITLSIVPLLIPFLVYPKYGRRVLLVNVLAFLGTFFTLPFTYKYSGGIFASDFVILIVTSAWIFLSAGKISGYVWTSLNLAIILFFWYAANAGWKNF
ncbi:MAG TPA: hypothetical protein VFU15_01665, partial [Bacteroidia bacterium]|nr:hypothetical protein [Bacteroidia bacterium]